MFFVGQRVRRLGDSRVMTVTEVWVCPYEVSVDWVDSQGRPCSEVLDPADLVPSVPGDALE